MNRFLGHPREGWAYFEMGTLKRLSPYFKYKPEAVRWRKQQDERAEKQTTAKQEEREP